MQTHRLSFMGACTDIAGPSGCQSGIPKEPVPGHIFPYGLRVTAQLVYTPLEKRTLDADTVG